MGSEPKKTSKVKDRDLKVTFLKKPNLLKRLNHSHLKYMSTNENDLTKEQKGKHNEYDSPFFFIEHHNFKFMY